MNLQVLESQFWSLCLQGVALGFIYVLISLGYTMVYGVLRLINFANSEVFMVGTFATVVAQVGILQNETNSQSLHGFRLIYTLTFALIFSMLVCGFLGVLVELVAYRRLRSLGAKPLGFLISAIAVSIVLLETIRIVTYSRPQTSPRLLDKWSFGEFAGANFRIDTVMVIISGIVIFFLLLIVSSPRLD